MKNLLFLFFFLVFGDIIAQKTTEKWIYLFNGKDLNDWQVKIRGHELNENFGNTFSVEYGLLKVSYEQYTSFEKKYGHLFYKKSFGSYLLSMEYRFVGEQAPDGEGWAFRNSGAMIHGQPAATMQKDQDFPISIEVQLLGGTGKGDRTTANLCTPGTNVEMNGNLVTDHCISSQSKTYHGDQWVRAEILVLGDSIIKHIVNGDTVLVYEKPQIGGGNVSAHDPKVKTDGKLLKEGTISLQSESHPIEFREVKLFDLEPYMNDPKKLKNVLAKLRKKKKIR